MKRRLLNLLIVVMFGFTLIFAGTMPKAYAASNPLPAQATVLLFDDFNGTSLDTTLWHAGNTNIANQYPVRPENVSLATYNDNGTNISVVDTLMFGDLHSGAHRQGGLLITNNKYAGGSYEVRMKNMPGPNGCSCFWNYYDPLDTSPTGPGTYTEIDIEMPAHANPAPAWSTWQHILGFNTWNPTSADADATYINYTSSLNPFDGNFHIYRFDWYDGINGSKKIQWYMDGILQSSTTAHVGDSAAPLWVGNWPAPWPGMVYNFDTVHLYIDWVKITALGGPTNTPAVTATRTNTPTGPTATKTNTPTGGGGTNLIVNPGWETGALNPWGSYNNSVVTGNAHTGTYSMKDTSDGSGEQTITGLTANTTYTLTGWAKVGTGTMDIGAKNFGGTTTYATSASTAWTQLTVTFTTGASNTSAIVYCYRSSGAAGGVGYCDDMSLTGPGGAVTPTPTNTLAPTATRTNTPAPNRVTNPGFETGALSPWTVWTNSVVASNAHTGTYSMRVGTGEGSGEQIITGLSANTTYTLTGWAKVSASGVQVNIGAKNFGGTQVYQAVTSTSYTQGTVTFTTGASNTSVTIYCYKPTTTGYAYCDDFTLTP